jgi:hypothetical protein
MSEIRIGHTPHCTLRSLRCASARGWVDRLRLREERRGDASSKKYVTSLSLPFSKYFKE